MSDQEILALISGLTETQKKSVVKHIKGLKKKKIPAICVKTYRELWPTGKLASGKYARVSISNLERVFTWFFTQHDYEWEIIYSATKQYIEECKTTSNGKYMMTSQYFICKERSKGIKQSELADWCDAVIEGTVISKSTHIPDKVV